MTVPKAFRIHQILVAADFTPYSDHALDAALALAEHFGARLHLLHVVHHAHEQDPARARLDAFARERVAGLALSMAVATGSPAAEIVAYAEREKVDLIVMGTHGRTRPLTHLGRGRVAEAVMRHAPCQVLTIGRTAELPLEAEAPVAERPQAPDARAGGTGRCLVCALPSDQLVCDTCKARIQAEAFYRLQREERAGR